MVVVKIFSENFSVKIFYSILGLGRHGLESDNCYAGPIILKERCEPYLSDVKFMVYKNSGQKTFMAGILSQHRGWGKKKNLDTN